MRLDPKDLKTRVRPWFLLRNRDAWIERKKTLSADAFAAAVRAEIIKNTVTPFTPITFGDGWDLTSGVAAAAAQAEIAKNTVTPTAATGGARGVTKSATVSIFRGQPSEK